MSGGDMEGVGMMDIVVRARHQAEQLRKYGHRAVGAPAANDIDGYAEEIARLRAEVERLREALNTPEITDFAEAIQKEMAHQSERWGADHDAEKSPEDWLWVIAFLATKATQAARYGDRDKYLHHIITTAAACGSWHRAALNGEAQ